MESIFQKIDGFFLNIGADQWVAIVLFIFAFSLAKTVLKNGLSILFYVVGVLAALYFFAPGLYELAWAFVLRVVDALIRFFS